MNDLISRQAALNAIEKLILPQAKGETAAEEINRIAWRCAINCAEEMIGHLPAIEAEPQKAYEQGVKDALDKYDEIFRIASDIRCAVGCKTAKECRDLIRDGEIQRVKHGRWIEDEYSIPHCSNCGTINNTVYRNYCPNCGADMREVKNG